MRAVAGLLIRDLGDEIVALSPLTGRAHALTDNLATVWRVIAPSADPAQPELTAAELVEATGLAHDQVLDALDELVAADLITGAPADPGTDELATRRVGRRAVLAGAGAGAVGVTGIVSVLLPTAVAAATGPALVISNMSGCSGATTPHTFTITVTLTGYTSGQTGLTATITANTGESATSTGLTESSMGSGMYVGSLTISGASATGSITVNAYDSSSNLITSAPYTYSCTPPTYAWGDNMDGELGNSTNSGTGNATTTPVTVTGLPAGTVITALSAGPAASHCLAVTSTGAVYAWGLNTYGQLGNNSTTNSSTPVQVHGVGGTGTLITAVAAGYYHSLAVTSTGAVYAWGSNNDGQLGNNSGTSSPTPVQVHGVGNTGNLSGITAVAAGQYHSLAVNASTGAVYAWGLNSSGQLGNGNTTNSNYPVQVLAGTAPADKNGFLTGITAIAAGSPTLSRSPAPARSTPGAPTCSGNSATAAKPAAPRRSKSSASGAQSGAQIT